MHWIKELIYKVDRIYNVVDHAKAMGTYNAMDRSRQYESVNASELNRAVNEAWTNIRRCQRELQLKEKAISDLKKSVESRIWHRIVVIVAAAEFTLIVMLLEKFAK